MRSDSLRKLNAFKGASMEVLRNRMIEEMKLGHFSPGTQESYVYAVSRLAGFTINHRISSACEDLTGSVVTPRRWVVPRVSSISVCVWFLRPSQTARGSPFPRFAADEFEQSLVLFNLCVSFPGNALVVDHSVAVQYPKRAVVESAMRMLLLADQPVAPRYVKVAVRNIEVRELLAEERERIFAMSFKRIGRDHYEIGSRFKNIRIILLQRSSHAGGSVRVIPVTILARENQFFVTCCQLT